ncbi:MAG: O-antigen polymerase [Pseudomonadota bacterium]
MHLLITGWALVVLGVAFILFYLASEKGRVFDPICVSWIGFIVFIAVAMILASSSKETRVSEDVRSLTSFYTVLGALSYLIGLYAGKGLRIAYRMPAPAVAFTKIEIWAVWVISVIGFFLVSAAQQFTGGAVERMLEGITVGFIGSTALISTYSILYLKRSLITKTVMLSAMVIVISIFISLFFSKRPLIGIVIAVLGYLYAFKISKYSLKSRWIFLLLTLFAAILTQFYLGTTRGHRFHSAIKETPPIFSQKALDIELGGITINYLAFELGVEKVPSEYDYLNGAGIVPGFTFLIPRSLWPSKPVGTGYFISQLWLGKEKPEWNLSPLPIGELYLNFGEIGIIVGLFLVGKFVRFFNSYMILHRKNSIIWLAWFMIIPDFVGEWRGDFTSMTAQGFMRVAVFVSLMLIVSMARKAMHSRISYKKAPWPLMRGNRPVIMHRQGRLSASK